LYCYCSYSIVTSETKGVWVVRFHGKQELIKEKISQGVYFPTKEQALQAAIYDMYKPTMEMLKLRRFDNETREALTQCDTLEEYLHVINENWHSQKFQVNVEKLIPAKISASDLDDLTVAVDDDIHGYTHDIEET
jgi:hypothetical protein